MSKNRNRNTRSYKQAQIDICIPTAGRFDTLSKCLDAVYQEAQLLPINVYILDNGSDAKEKQENLHLFQYQADKDPLKNIVKFVTKRLPKNMGFPIAANECIKMGIAPIAMLLTDDVELQAGAIEKVLQTFLDPTIGIVGIKLLFPKDSTSPTRPAGKVQHCGMAVNIQGMPFHPLNGWSDDNPKTNVSRDVWAVTGACIAIRRNLFGRLGGFDPVYGRGTYEDVDLCLKVRASGSRVFFNAEARGYHYVGATAEKRNEPFPIQQNMQIFMSRWHNSGQIFWNEFEWW